MDITPHTILSVNEAVRLMHGRDSKCRQQLHDWGIVRDMSGTKCVVYGDILDRLRETDTVSERRSPSHPRRSR